MSFIPLLQAAAPDGTQAGLGGGGLITFLPLLLLFVVFYFFLIRPQNKKQKETQKMIDALKKGDKVITIGGIHGVVSSVKDKTVVVKVDDNAKIEFNKTAIATVEKSEEEIAAEAKKAVEAKEAKKSKKAKKEDDAEKAEINE